MSSVRAPAVTIQSQSLRAEPLGLSGMMRVTRIHRSDARGSLARLFCAQELKGMGWPGVVEQVNHTVTVGKGTVRGLHFQTPPFAEAKLVTCIRGAVWDVAVDVRRDSATFLQHVGLELSAANCCAALIPPGCAHGFQALADEVELIYVHSEPYVRTCEGGLHPCDPSLGIAWPLPVLNLSVRDSGNRLIGDTGFCGLDFF